MPMDHNNNVIDSTDDPVLSSSFTSSSQCQETRSSPAASQLSVSDGDEEREAQEDGVRGNSLALVSTEKDCCDGDSQRLNLPKRESDASSRDSEPQDLVTLDEIRDDIELIVDLYLILENTRWLFHSVLW